MSDQKPIEPIPTISIDALLPQQIAVKAEMSGYEKARQPALKIIALALMAGAVGDQVIAVATYMAGSNAIETFFHGVLGNVLVCLAIWLSYSGRSTTDRILAILAPITA